MIAILSTADINCVLQFIFTRFGSPGEDAELPDEIVAAMRRLEQSLHTPIKPESIPLPPWPTVRFRNNVRRVEFLTPRQAEGYARAAVLMSGLASILQAGPSPVRSATHAGGKDRGIVLEALQTAQNNLGARRPSGSSDPDSPNYNHDAFMWDYYQRAIDAARQESKGGGNAD